MILAGSGFAQILGQADSARVITTGVPFLAISPDARSAGMGDAGVAISPDANSVHWNAAKLAFLESDFGVSGSYTPWLSNVVNDMSISYLSGYKRIADGQTLALAMRYFDLGNIQLTNANGNLLNLVSPREFTIGGTFAMKLSEKFSAGLTARFIHSNLLTGTTYANGSSGKPGISASADVAVYYTSPVMLGAGRGAGRSVLISLTLVLRSPYLSESTADFLPYQPSVGYRPHHGLGPFQFADVCAGCEQTAGANPYRRSGDSKNQYR